MRLSLDLGRTLQELRETLGYADYQTYAAYYAWADKRAKEQARGR